MTELEVTGLLFKLADMGITGVFISYEGSGDSGQIDSISYTKEEVNTMADLEAIYDTGIDFNDNLNNLDSSLYSDIENFAYEALLDDIEDWYNNEGGFGYIVVHVKSGEYKTSNNIRYYETEEHIHTGKLTEKAEEK